MAMHPNAAAALAASRANRKPRTRLSGEEYKSWLKSLKAGDDAVRTLAKRFWSKVDTNNGYVPTHMPHIGHCWNWTAYITHDGYGQIAIGSRVERTRRMERAHRVSWFIANFEWPTVYVLHKCDNRLCVRPDHLFLGTVVDNNKDTVSKGRSAKGDRHPSRLYPEARPRGMRHGMAKITEDQAKEIWLRKQSGEGPCALGREFGISHSQVCNIGRTKWMHILKDPTP